MAIFFHGTCSFPHLRYIFADLCQICIKKNIVFVLCYVKEKNEKLCKKNERKRLLYERKKNSPFDMEYLICYDKERDIQNKRIVKGGRIMKKFASLFFWIYWKLSIRRFGKIFPTIFDFGDFMFEMRPDMNWSVVGGFIEEFILVT